MVVIRGARAANRSELNIPAKRDLFLLRRSLVRKLSANDDITHSPAVGGRMKRNGESGQLQRQDPQKQIGRTFRGKQPVFPSGGKRSKRPAPITLFKRNAALCRLRFAEVANQRARSLVRSESHIKEPCGARAANRSESSIKMTRIFL